MARADGRLDLTIRIANVADADALSALGMLTFVQAFGADNTPEDIAAHISATFSPERQALEIADPSSRLLVAEIGSTLAGYAKLHSGDAPSCVSSRHPVELARIYILEEWQGHGLGAALIARCVAEAQMMGAETIWLGVWERNERAHEFYRRWGFSRVGEKYFMVGTDKQHDWVMERDIRPVRQR